MEEFDDDFFDGEEDNEPISMHEWFESSTSFIRNSYFFQSIRGEKNKVTIESIKMLLENHDMKIDDYVNTDLYDFDKLTWTMVILNQNDYQELTSQINNDTPIEAPVYIVFDVIGENDYQELEIYYFKDGDYFDELMESVENNPQQQLYKLELELKMAVENEEFEQASTIRDKIIKLKKQINKQSDSK